MCEYINRKPRINQEALERLQYMSIDALRGIWNVKLPCSISMDVRELTRGSNPSSDMAFNLEKTIQERTNLGIPTHLRILCHSIRLGCDQSIWTAIQEKRDDSAANCLGALPTEAEIMHTLTEYAEANVDTENTILRLAQRLGGSRPQLLGSVEYGAHPHLECVEAIRIQQGDPYEEEALASDVWYYAPILPGVRRSNMAGIRSEKGSLIHGQLSQVWDSRWLSREVSPPPIVDSDAHARRLYAVWSTYRDQAKSRSNGER